MEELLKFLEMSESDFNRNARGEFEYTIPDMSEFGRLYSRLDLFDGIDEDDDLSALTTDRSTITFVGDGYTVSIQGDFDTDSYDLIIKED